MALRFDFTGKAVLVTGGSQGIGYGIASAFARAGAEVTITGTRGGIDDYEDDLSGFRYFQLDLNNTEARGAFADQFGRIDILVNNAGLTAEDEYSLVGYSRIMEVNLNAVVDLCYSFYERLCKSSGAIVNVGSGASFIAIRKHPAYTASKAGMLGFTRAIADKWAPDGIRVNMVAPGFVDTRITDWAQEPERKQGVIQSIPLGRIGLPEDIAAAVLFLATEEAGYIVGQGLLVDGGLLLR